MGGIGWMLHIGGVHMKKFLRQGPQTKLTPKIREISTAFKGEGTGLLGNILDWIKTLKYKKNISLAFSRTAEEIIKSGFVTGCQDEGIVFVTFCRAKEIPASYIQAVKTADLLKIERGRFDGHVFSRVFVGNKIYFVDPSRKKIFETQDFGTYTPVAEGLDPHNIGVKNLEDFQKLFLKFRNQ